MRVPSIRVIESAGEMAQVCRTAGRTVGLVPTMGALKVAVGAVVGAAVTVGSAVGLESPPPQAVRAKMPMNKTIIFRYIVFFHPAKGSIL